MTHYPGRLINHAAFLKDPDGNNIDASCEEPTRRSAQAVLVERLAET